MIPRPSLSPEIIERLSRPSAWRSWLAIAGAWVPILTCFWLVVEFPHPLVWAFCFIVIGRQNYSFIALLHEASHYHLFRSRKLNEFVGQWICGGPATFHMGFFKKFHTWHHSHPLQKEVDPDYPTIGVYPVTKKSFLRKVARDLTGVTNYRGHIKLPFRRAFSSWEGLLTEARNCVSIFVSQALIFTGFAIAGHPWYYFFFWVLPPMTVGVLLFRIGSIAQHGGLVSHQNQAYSTRTMLGWFQNFWFLPYGTNYHIEHHLYPSVVFFRLGELHELLMENGSLPRHNVEKSYVRVLRKLVTG